MSVCVYVCDDMILHLTQVDETGWQAKFYIDELNEIVAKNRSEDNENESKKQHIHTCTRMYTLIGTHTYMYWCVCGLAHLFTCTSVGMRKR